jgi:hypothetical protein
VALGSASARQHSRHGHGQQQPTALATSCPHV